MLSSSTASGHTTSTSDEDFGLRGSNLGSPGLLLPPAVDHEILEEALRSVRALHGFEDRQGLRWIVGPGIRTRSSTLFPLRLSDAEDHSVSAYYKVYEDSRVSRVGPRLDRARELTNQLVRSCEPENISVPFVLAASPEAATIVTSRVPGSPMGALFPYRLTPRRRRLALDIYRRIGKAINLIETVRPPNERVSAPKQWDGADLALQRAQGFLSPPDWHALKHSLRESFSLGEGNAPVSYAHGDISGGNLLLSEDSLGIVDFQWQVRWAGYDLVTVACRTLFNPTIAEGWARSLVDAMIDGYGDRDVASSPAWIFYTLRRALQFAVKPSGRWVHRIRSRRARDYLSQAAHMY